jgi:hypothetical protein
MDIVVGWRVEVERGVESRDRERCAMAGNKYGGKYGGKKTLATWRISGEVSCHICLHISLTIFLVILRVIFKNMDANMEQIWSEKLLRVCLLIVSSTF